MKIREGFVLRRVGKEQVVVAVGAAMSQLNGLIKLNDTGAQLWKLLEQGAEETDLAKTLVDTYGINEEQALSDVDAFLAPLREVGCLETA